MNICLLGKYPPIEGGVSTSTYWLARGLAERGHEIHVVTNADEVEDVYRLSLQPDDCRWYQPEFATGGRVRVYNAQGFNHRTMGHIPKSNPFVSKLASVATGIVRQFHCDAIVAYYYEPYLVAGWLASRWTGRPLVAKHAGSDLDRLFRVPDLAIAYTEILRSTDAVVTQARLVSRFIGMGVPLHRIYADIPYSIPKEVFHPEAIPLDVGRTAVPFRRLDGAPAQEEYNSDLPAIGVYGKVGTSKGTFDLIASLGALAREGFEFNLLTMVGRAQAEFLGPAVKEAALEERMYVLPFSPNWRVPSFIRACSAVCFLERDFPVAIHGPMIPREVLSCGTCLVLSGEIAAKQWYRDKFASGENVLIVEDPKDTKELAGTLRLVIENPELARFIGQQGTQISNDIEDHKSYASEWEKTLIRIIRGSDSPASEDRGQLDVRDAAAGTAGIEAVAPELVAVLRHGCGSIIEEFLQESLAVDPIDSAIRLCDFAAERLGRQNGVGECKKLLSAIQYAKARLVSTQGLTDEAAPVFSVTDRLQGLPVSNESVWDLRPVRSNWIQVERLEYDVSALFTSGVLQGALNGRADLSTVPLKHTILLFERSANLVARELRIDEATLELLDLCDGTRTTGELVDYMRRFFRTSGSEPSDALAGRLLAALQHLYRANVIVFGEYRPGWGWTGGARRPGENSAGPDMVITRVSPVVAKRLVRAVLMEKV